MFHIALYQPEIPPNTGNIIRLCANCGATLHLVHPLGFELDDRRLRRAGLDYFEWSRIRQYPSLADLYEALGSARTFAFTTKGKRSYDQVRYRGGDALMFGPETRGLPESLLDQFPVERRLRIPMRAGGRSLNLSNAVAVAAFEVWRQLDFSMGE
jgi:tRNA (cytidine/uridine-2'-O-)-methyltransferase